MSLAAEQPSTVGSSAMPARSASSGSAQARRTLRFESLDDILHEIERIGAGSPTATGAWTPSQNIDHVRRLIRFSREGGSIKVPLLFRLLGPMMKSKFLAATFNPGMKTADPFQPPRDITLADAVEAFRVEVGLASRPGAMSQRSPVLGKMTHEQWGTLHCRNAELHLGYVFPGDGAEGGAP